ncbi:TrkH family potassium uptake protein [Maricaulis sp. CAU 1757]
MTPAALLRPLGALWVLVAMVAVLAAFSAAAMGERHLAPLFLTTAGLALVPGLFILAATRGVTVGASALDAMGLALLAWVTAPIMAALPFWLTGYFDPIDALFEAYSAVTTTGATLLPADDLPRSLVFWRAILAWLGGYATLLLAVAVFAALDRDVPAIRKSTLLTQQHDNVFAHLPRAAKRIGLIYSLLTAFIWIGLLFSGEPLFNAIVLSMSAISTSGYVPADGGLMLTSGSVTGLVVAFGCLLGSLNIALFWDLLRDRSAVRDPDLAGLMALIFGLAVLYALADQSNILGHLVDAVFVVTTAGFSFSGDETPVPVAAVFIALIGGAAASTSGGIKVSRILLLWRRMGSELAVLSDPSAIVPVTFRGRTVRDSALIGIWAYVLGFAATLGVGGVLLALAGMNFEDSFLGIAVALANAGPLFEQVNASHSWSDVPNDAKPVLMAAMILGRLEVLAALAALWALFMRK